MTVPCRTIVTDLCRTVVFKIHTALPYTQKCTSVLRAYAHNNQWSNETIEYVTHDQVRTQLGAPPLGT